MSFAGVQGGSIRDLAVGQSELQPGVIGVFTPLKSERVTVRSKQAQLPAHDEGRKLVEVVHHHFNNVLQSPTWGDVAPHPRRVLRLWGVQGLSHMTILNRTPAGPVPTRHSGS